MTIDYDPTDHPRTQGAIERLGGWIHEILVELCKSWPWRWMNTCSRLSGCTGPPPTHGCQTRPPPSAYYSAVSAVPRWTLPHQAPTTRAWTDSITSSPTRAKTFKCWKFARTYSTAMSRDASDESVTTQGSDAPLTELSETR